MNSKKAKLIRKLIDYKNQADYATLDHGKRVVMLPVIARYDGNGNPVPKFVRSNVTETLKYKPDDVRAVYQRLKEKLDR